MNDGDEFRRQREHLKRAYRGAFERLNDILFAEDPVGLDFEGNTDEYEPEVGTILPRLRECGAVEDVRRVVHEEFVRWFDSAAGPAELYQVIAERIWTEVVPVLRE